MAKLTMMHSFFILLLQNDTLASQRSRDLWDCTIYTMNLHTRALRESLHHGRAFMRFYGTSQEPQAERARERERERERERSMKLGAVGSSK